MLLALFDKWWAAPTDITRLAIGCAMSVVTGTPDEAREIIFSQIPAFDHKRERISDFVLQINRPRPSCIEDGIEINRLCRWLTLSAQFFSIVPPPLPGSASASPVPSAVINHRAHLEVDINTSAAIPKVPGALVRPLFSEMIELIRQIAETGDRA
jgi:hypothetical protein